MGRGLKELDLLALFIDGIETAEHTIVTALGVDADGHKHPLGLWEGSTENKTVCQALLNNLIERGNGGLSSRLDGASPSPGESQRPRRGRPVASQRLTLLTRRVKLSQSVLRRSVQIRGQLVQNHSLLDGSRLGSRARAQADQSGDTLWPTS
jgi:hypothetical protein